MVDRRVFHQGLSFIAIGAENEAASVPVATRLLYNAINSSWIFHGLMLLSAAEYVTHRGTLHLCKQRLEAPRSLRVIPADRRLSSLTMHNSLKCRKLFSDSKSPADPRLPTAC